MYFLSLLQCFNISATDLVEDVKMALSGRAPPQRQRHGSQNSLPPAPVQPPPDPPFPNGKTKMLFNSTLFVLTMLISS